MESVILQGTWAEEKYALVCLRVTAKLNQFFMVFSFLNLTTVLEITTLIQGKPSFHTSDRKWVLK